MDDLISRKKAIEALFDWEMTYNWDDHCREEDPKPAYIVSPSDVIEQLPSAQPERKKGKWIEIENEWGGLEIICSECGVQVPRDVWGNAIQSDYCYRCGADVTKITNVPLVDDCPTCDEWFVISEDFSFCPSCGCEIKGEEDD